MAAKRRRAEFIRNPIVRAIRETEEDRTRRAYELQPDSESEADDWSNCEESALVKRIGQLGPARREEAKRALGHSLGWDELISV